MDSFSEGYSQVNFWKITGEVLSNSRFSETYLSGSGGEARIGPYGGYVRAPEVQSDVVNHQEIWIRASDGQEVSLSLRNNDVPLRAGQHITVVGAKKNGDNSGVWILLVNHSSRKYSELISRASLMRHMHLEDSSGFTTFFSLFVGAVTLMLSAQNGEGGMVLSDRAWWIAGAACAVTWLVGFVVAETRVSGLRGRFERHMNRVLEDATGSAEPPSPEEQTDIVPA